MRIGLPCFLCALAVFVGCDSEDPEDATPATATSDATTSTGAAMPASTTGSSTGGASTSTGMPSATETSEGEPVCPDVEGMYYVGYDFDQRQVCRDALTTTNACGVTQDGCTLYWACNGAFDEYLPAGPVDEEGVFHGEGRFGGGPFTCEIEFYPDSHGFDWTCITADRTVCTGGGF